MTLALMVFACVAPEPEVPTPGVTIGPEGGELVVGEVELRVPAGALDGEVRIIVRDTEQAPPAPYEGLSTVWSFEPVGLTFAAPVEVTLPYAPDDAPARLYWSNDEGGFDRVPGTAEAGRFTASIEHFSTAFTAMPVADVVEFTEFFPPADLVVVVDNSCSMSDEQFRIGEQLGGLLPPLLASGIDLHVGVVSTDLTVAPGRLRPAQGERFISASTVDPEDVFAQMVSLGTNGHYEEKGRGAAYTLLELERDAPANVDFYRDDGTLAMLFISDEEDQSGPTPIDEAGFLAWMQTVKTRPADVLAHAIIFPPGTSCPGSDTPSVMYAGYAQATGGELLNICDEDWTPGLAVVTERVLDTARVRLPSEPPGPPDVAIRTAGTARTLDPSEYTWDPVTLTVYFDQGTRPAIDDVVEVSYVGP